MTGPGGATSGDAQDEQPTPPFYGQPVDYPTGYTQDYPIGQSVPFAATGYPPPPQPGPPPPGPAQYGPPGPWPYPGPIPGPYPGGYYPGYQGNYGIPGAAQSATNGMAIASLIISFSGFFCCFGAVVAIVLGTIALNQVKQNRQRGYGLAVAGIVLGVAGFVVSLVVVLFAMQTR